MSNRKSFVIRSLGAVVTLAAVAFCSLNAQAEIVFGNLGASGTTPLGSTTTDVGTQDPVDVNWLAQGFNTGTSAKLTVTTISLGLYGADVGTIPLTVSLFTSGSDGKPNSLLYTSSITNVGPKNLYEFSFSNAVLQPSTNYFVVPNGGSWYFNTGSPSAPVVQNGSGYSAIGTFESYDQGTAPAGPWETAGSTRYSVSVEAVPEPSTVVMAGLGIAGVAVLERKRRQRRKARLEASEPDDYLG